MNISGITIVRNGVKLGYPFIESIRSILPLCSEMIIGVGDSEDDTRGRIEAINDPRIKIFDTVWDMSKRTGGLILSEQTNLMMAKCTGDWLFYIQADEVALEEDFDKVRRGIELAEKDPDIDGLAFDYVHFYGSYFTVQTGRNWYPQEVRIVRNRRGICSHGDAQGFRKDGKKIAALETGARLYHYGWARPPEVMVLKIKSFHRLWHDDDWIEKNCAGNDVRQFFSDLGNLVEFKGPHPAVMQERINRDSVAFIEECRAHYLKHRSLKQALKDLSRKYSLGQNRNFKLVKK
jgi:hypothetical protein